jgi:hypothetical protein
MKNLGILKQKPVHLIIQEYLDKIIVICIYNYNELSKFLYKPFDILIGILLNLCINLGKWVIVICFWEWVSFSKEHGIIFFYLDLSLCEILTILFCFCHQHLICTFWLQKPIYKPCEKLPSLYYHTWLLLSFLSLKHTSHICIDLHKSGSQLFKVSTEIFLYLCHLVWPFSLKLFHHCIYSYLSF